jgi:ribonucleotide reductase alpha subunit
MDASAGVLPVYSAFYNEDNKTGKFSVYGMYLRENPLSYEMTASRQDQSKLSRVIGSIQKFVDTGISAEYIFDQNDPNFSARSLFDLIVNAWKNKTKAIYYIRSIKKGETIDHITGGESVCVGCAG